MVDYNLATVEATQSDPFSEPGTVGQLLLRWISAWRKRRLQFAPWFALGVVAIAGVSVSVLSVSHPVEGRRVVEQWKSGTIYLCDHSRREGPDYRVEWQSPLGITLCLLSGATEPPRVAVVRRKFLAIATIDRQSGPGREMLITKVWSGLFSSPREQTNRTPLNYPEQGPEQTKPSHLIPIEIEVPMVGVGTDS